MRWICAIALLLGIRCFAGDHYFDLTIDHTKVAAAVSHFPVLITESNIPSAAWTYIVNGTGENLTASDPSQTVFPATSNQYPKEVVSMNTSTRKCELYVKVPSLSDTADTILRIWIGSTQSVANSSAVWSSAYLGVYHFESDAGDSTTNGYDFTMTGGTVTTGRIGNCMQFNGTSDVGLTAAAFFPAGNFTTMAYIRKTSSQSGLKGIIVSDGGNVGIFSDGNNYYSQIPGLARTAPAITLNSWYFYVLAQATSSPVMNYYMNGSTMYEAGSYAAARSVNRLRIGLFAGGYCSVEIDELRVMNNDYKADRTTFYNNLSNPSAFATAGSLQPPEIKKNVKQVLWL
jgi:hypothetical protein